MKFVFVSIGGDSLSTAQRVEQEGHDVVFLIAEPHRKSKGVPGAGLVSKVVLGPFPEGLRSAVRRKAGRDAVVVFDMTSSPKTKTGKAADELRKAGYSVIGASAFQDALELHRGYAGDLMRACGIPTPETRRFTDFKAGIDFAKAETTYLVFKPEGNHDTAETHVADDTEQLVRFIEMEQQRWTGPVAFTLQRKVDGVECSIEGWFNGTDWITGSINSTVEEKRFLTGGLGAQTGCMGNVVWVWKDQAPRLARDTLFKMRRILRRVNYLGPIDINTKGGKALEFTPRFGYYALQAFAELWEDEIGKVLADTARGQARRLRTRPGFAGAVGMSVPPFPRSEKAEEAFGTLVEVPDLVRQHWHPIDVQQGEEETLTCSGQSGALGLVTAVAPTLDLLDKDLYARARAVKAKDLQYRTDIVSFRARSEIPKLLKEQG